MKSGLPGAQNPLTSVGVLALIGSMLIGSVVTGFVTTAINSWNDATQSQILERLVRIETQIEGIQADIELLKQ